MKVLTVAWVLCLNHIRKGAVLIDMIAAALAVGIFLDPTKGPYDWSYLALYFGMTACFLPPITTVMVSATAANIRGETFLLRAGRLAYYAGVLVAALLMSLFWMGAMGAVIPFLTVSSLPTGWLALLATTVVVNAVLTVSLCTLFSALCGRSQELVVPIALVLMGLNDSWLEKIDPAWQRYLGALVPPLFANVSRAMAEQLPAVVHSGAYLAVLLGLGGLRFWYREFVRE